jgi:signal transduction histidine kinase
VRPEDESAIGQLTRALTALRDLIDQVLTADRLAGKLDPTREPLDLCAILDQLVTEARLSAEQRQIQLVIRAPATLAFQGDPRLLRSAIDNMLRNAIKFSHEGAVVEIRAEREEKRVVIEIEDRCGGLPQGSVAALFEPFVQRSEDRTGFGLGLAIVKQAVEAHGGKVRVRDLPGKGCVFSLELPDFEDQ